MSILNNITSGKQQATNRILVCGPPGIGKSSFASGFPKPIFLDAEKRTDHLDVDRIQIDTWENCLRCLKALTSEEHKYETVVIDTADALETLLITYLCEKYRSETLLEILGGWGAYKRPMTNEYKRLIRYIETLRSQGKQVIVLAHVTSTVLNPPDGKPYDAYVLHLDKIGQKIFEQHMDLIGFASFKTLYKEKTREAIVTDKRVIRWKYNPAYPSKPGVDFPDETELSYDGYAKAASS